jgi:hypothetical protein
LAGSDQGFDMVERDPEGSGELAGCKDLGQWDLSHLR